MFNLPWKGLEIIFSYPIYLFYIHLDTDFVCTKCAPDLYRTKTDSWLATNKILMSILLRIVTLVCTVLSYEDYSKSSVMNGFPYARTTYA